MMLLQDIFIYFAKYLTETAVAKAFNKSAAGPDYEAFRKKALAAAQGLFPAISDYVFGVDEELVKRKISQVKDTYLFIDYGNIASSTNSYDVKTDALQLAVTVARPISSNSYDQAEEILITEELLNIIARIRDDMRYDRSDPFVRRLTFPNDITPFFARELSNSFGWTLMFQLKGIDLL